jgi:hypothetical protein
MKHRLLTLAILNHQFCAVRSILPVWARILHKSTWHKSCLARGQAVTVMIADFQTLLSLRLRPIVAWL